MSGSSLDGLDIAACSFELNDENPELVWALEAGQTLPFSAEWQSRLRQLPQAPALQFARTHCDFGHYCAELLDQFLAAHPFAADFIASHGHTVFHYPAEWRLTVQIGDGAALAARSGLPVICDFRTQDTALGGQGAPLAPIADRLLFGNYDFYLNLGGIANISAQIADRTIAFDIGGANQVLNALAALRGLEYDAEGALAAQGQVLPELLASVDQLPYFTSPWPKSLDNQWVQEQIIPHYLNYSASVEDRLRTACEQLARQLVLSIRQIKQQEQLAQPSYRLLATGGGAMNDFLMERLREHCRAEQVEIVLPQAHIIAYKEALLMALMGVLRLENRSNCLQSVTGSARDAIGGAIYQGHTKMI